MLIIADKKIPEEAKNKLLKFGELVLLETSDITEESISGHPDIFFCKTTDKLFIAPNLPDLYKNILSEKNISFIEGKLPVELKYPSAARYNAVITDCFFIHRTNITEPTIYENCNKHKQINVQQGFTRCNLLPLNDNKFVTSDEGVSKALTIHGLHVLKVTSSDIILPGHKNGFFGGVCGIFENKIFILGNLNYFREGDKLKVFFRNSGYEIIELYDGPLFDGGSILFL